MPRNLTRLVLLCVALISDGVLAYEIRPISEDDIVTRERLTATQQGTQPVSFIPDGTSKYKIFFRDSEKREYVRMSLQRETFTLDKHLTTVASNNKPLSEDWQFVRMPIGQPLRPGMQWNLPSSKFRASCADSVATAEYTAVSSVGPKVDILINDASVAVPTIRIDYAGYARGCFGSHWRVTIEALYSPQLDDFISHKVIHWHTQGTQGNDMLFMQAGFGWRVTSIETAPPEVQAVVAK